MKTIIILLPFFFMFYPASIRSNRFIRFFPAPKTANDLGHYAFVSLSAKLPIDEKTIDRTIEIINEESKKYNFDRKEALELLSWEINYKIWCYEQINKQQKIDYAPLYLLGTSIVMGFCCYFFHCSLERHPHDLAKIEKELSKLGASSTSAWRGVAFVKIPYGSSNVKKIKSLARQLASSSDDSGTISGLFISFVLSLITGALGISNLKDQLYPSYYQEQYCFLQKKLNLALQE
jgi:hypothetical protein